MSDKKIYEIDGKCYVRGDELTTIPLDGLFVDPYDQAHRAEPGSAGTCAVLEHWRPTVGRWAVTCSVGLPIHALVPAPVETLAGAELRKWLVNNPWEVVESNGREVRWNPDEVEFQYRFTSSQNSWWRAYERPFSDHKPVRGHW